ncbi:MAG: M28 family peptidase, partial [Oscillospiraceae bacterium]|nr:M28 family peptidase [Oscillospiraceae bacterium]
MSKTTCALRTRFMIVLFLMLAVLTLTAANRADVAPIITDDGQIFVPLRLTSETLGYTVTWEDATKTAFVHIGDDFTADFDTINNEYVSLISGTTYVCVEYLAETLGVFYAQTGEELYALWFIDDPDVDIMIANLEIITETPRVFGDENIIASRDFIFDYLEELGYDAEIHEFSMETWIWNPETEEGEVAEITGYNVIGIKPADSLSDTGDILVLGAHYDTVARTPGANDNGSGTVAVLEIARLIADLPSDTEIRFALFDGEEMGLLGAYYYLMSLEEEELDRIVGMINFDMFASTHESAINLRQIITVDGSPNYLTEMFPEYELRSGTGSDHTPFSGQAIHAISFTCMDSVWSDVYYHQPTDTIETICREKLFMAVDRGSKVVAKFMCDSTASYDWVNNIEIDRETVYKIDFTKFGGRIPLFNYMDFGYWAAENEIVAAQFLVRMGFEDGGRGSMSFKASYAAMIDWWGTVLETHFEAGQWGGVEAIRAVIENEAQFAAINKILDEKFTAIPFNEEDLYESYPYYGIDEDGEEVMVISRYLRVEPALLELMENAAGIWKDNYGTRYILTKDALVLTQYNVSRYVEVVDGVPVGLSEKEQ